MTEAKLKAGLCKLLRKELPNAVIFRHEDIFTAGIPDISVTWKGHTTWIEVKFAKPQVKGKGIQQFTLERLSDQGSFAFYVIYHLQNGMKRTIISIPEEDWKDSRLSTSGHDHRFVLNWIRKLHDG